MGGVNRRAFIFAALVVAVQAVVAREQSESLRSLRDAAMNEASLQLGAMTAQTQAVSRAAGADFPFSEILRPPLLSGCQACERLVSDLAAWAKANPDSVTPGNTSTQAQIICQQHSFAPLLGLYCSQHSLVQDWLAAGGILVTGTVKDKPVLTAVTSSMVPVFCSSPRVNLCGEHGTGKHIPKRRAMAVRFKLSIDTSLMARGSSTWRDFVRQLLEEVALAIDCPPNRLELHDHANDDQVEFVIRAAAIPEISTEDPSAKGTQRDIAIKDNPASPLELGLRFKDLVERGSPLIRAPDHLLSNIDFNYRVQVFPVD